MKCITIKMQQSYADDLERQNERLRRQLEGLGIDLYSAGTSIARPSESFREWSPWPDTYQHDDPSREWSPWPDTHQHDDLSREWSPGPDPHQQDD